MPGITESERERAARVLFFTAATLLAILLRVRFFPLESGDYHQFLHGWFTRIRESGGLASIGMDLGDYMPPYFYLLALLSYFPLNDLLLIKLLSCAADVFLAYFVLRLVELYAPRGLAGPAAYAAVLFLPSVVLNSAAWGQCDAIYTAGLVACVYNLARGKDVGAVAAFSVAFVFKLQAVFLAPFLLLMLIKGKLRARSLLVFPAVYLLAVLPAALMGRDFLSLLTVYYRQAGQYSLISMFLPNLYTWFPTNSPAWVSRLAVLGAGALVLLSVGFLCRRRFRFTQGTVVSLALYFVLLVPYFLPHMHERYFYPADVLSVAYAFFYPKKFYVPVVTGLCSAYAVCHNLFDFHFIDVRFLSFLMLIVMISVAAHVEKLTRGGPENRVVRAWRA